MRCRLTLLSELLSLGLTDLELERERILSEMKALSAEASVYLGLLFSISSCLFTCLIIS